MVGSAVTLGTGPGDIIHDSTTEQNVLPALKNYEKIQQTSNVLDHMIEQRINRSEFHQLFYAMMRLTL
jgi:hypothetical protein